MMIDGIILLNKEKEMTSFKAVKEISKIFGIDKAGHSGTLDPNATGLLVVMLGRSTKVLPFIEKDEKSYHCRLLLGKHTDTYDIWGTTIDEIEPSIYQEGQIIEVLNSFLGTIEQFPPIYSAIKVKGKKLYEYARNNQSVEIKSRIVEIKSIDFIKYQNNIIDFRVTCSAGTYIRSLCVDIAKKLNTLGCMCDLNRLSCGSLQLSNASTLDEIKAGNYQIISNEEVLSHYPLVEYSDLKAIKNGVNIIMDNPNDQVMLTNDGKIIACYQRKNDNIYGCLRGLW